MTGEGFASGRCSRRATSKPLAAEVDVEQGDVGFQLLDQVHGFAAVRGDADNSQSLTLQQAARGVDESLAVVHDQAAFGHSTTVVPSRRSRIPVNQNL
jgi:hypothetical protein